MFIVIPMRARFFCTGTATLCIGGAVHEQLEDKGIPGLHVHQFLVPDLPPRVLQQGKGLADLVPDLPRPVRDRRIVFRCEHLVGDLAFQRVEDLQLLGPGRPVASYGVLAK